MLFTPVFVATLLASFGMAIPADLEKRITYDPQLAFSFINVDILSSDIAAAQPLRHSNILRTGWCGGLLWPGVIRQ